VDYWLGARAEAVSITCVGEESNLLEDVENEIAPDWDDGNSDTRTLDYIC
jgi:hypothetical protein